jgi:hypothetical protein
MNALILVSTFVTIDVALSLAGLKSSFLRRVLNATQRAIL